MSRKDDFCVFCGHDLDKAPRATMSDREDVQGVIAELRSGVGANLIAAERRRQLEREGWTPEHDDSHVNAELVEAAICYAEAGSGFDLSIGYTEHGCVPRIWPWEADAWKPDNDLCRNLVKAGALIAAEIDRLQRASALLSVDRQTSAHEQEKEKELARMGSQCDPDTSSAAATVAPDSTVGAGDLGLSIDMLDVDRLREWARLLLECGPDISLWGDRFFVVSKMQQIATGLEKAVRDIGLLRAHCQSWPVDYAALAAKLDDRERRLARLGQGVSNGD